MPLGLALIPSNIKPLIQAHSITMAIQTRSLLLVSACVALFVAAASAATGPTANTGATTSGPTTVGSVDCAAITGCSECIPMAYNLKEATAKFAAMKAQQAQVKAARVQAAAAKAASATTAATKSGRALLEAEEIDEAEVVAAADAGLPADMAVAPSCTACMEGYALVTKSVRGRPPMGRCECAVGYGIQHSTFNKLNRKGETKLRKTFSCSQCGPNSVPLTPAAGLKVTNAGVILLQEPLIAVAEGETIPRKAWLPGKAQKKFALVPGQCVECPAGSTKSTDGMTCEVSV